MFLPLAGSDICFIKVKSPYISVIKNTISHVSIIVFKTTTQIKCKAMKNIVNLPNETIAIVFFFPWLSKHCDWVQVR